MYILFCFLFFFCHTHAKTTTKVSVSLISGTEVMIMATLILLRIYRRRADKNWLLGLMTGSSNQLILDGRKLRVPNENIKRLMAEYYSSNKNRIHADKTERYDIPERRKNSRIMNWRGSKLPRGEIIHFSLSSLPKRGDQREKSESIPSVCCIKLRGLFALSLKISNICL